MKKIIIFFLCLYATAIQSRAQSLKEIGKICEGVNKGNMAGAENLFYQIKEAPKISNKSAMNAVSYFYLKYFFLNQEEASGAAKNPTAKAKEMKELEAALDTIGQISLVYKTMPRGGVFSNIFIKNTQNKLHRHCRCVDSLALAKLSKLYEEGLSGLKAQNQVVLPIGPIGDLKSNDDSLKNVLRKMEMGMTEVNQKEEAYKKMLGESITTSVKKATKKEKLPKKVVKDSVTLVVKVHAVDSIEIQAYLARKSSGGLKETIEKQHGIGEFCNEKVDAMIRNAVFEVMKRWFNLLAASDSLIVSATISGEADDIWGKVADQHVFRKSDICEGIGNSLGLKAGDGISNDTIALLRMFSSELCLNDGIGKIISVEKENGKPNAGIEVRLITKLHKDWMKETGVQRGPQFRKKVIILTCHNCLARKK